MKKIVIITSIFVLSVVSIGLADSCAESVPLNHPDSLAWVCVHLVEVNGQKPISDAILNVFGKTDIFKYADGILNFAYRPDSVDINVSANGYAPICFSGVEFKAGILNRLTCKIPTPSASVYRSSPYSIDFSISYDSLPEPSIGGVVLNSFNGKPVENATVSVNDSPKTHTDSQGRFEISVKKRVKEFSVKVLTEGFRIYESEMLTRDKRCQVVKISLEPELK